MIARLRQRHRRLTVWAGAMAAIGFVAAIMARPSRPIQSSMPSVDTSAWTEIDLISQPGSGGRLRAALEGSPGDEWLNLEREPGLALPDLLVYLTRPDHKDDALLLGSLGDAGVHRYRLPTVRERDLLWIWRRGEHQRSVAFHRLDELVLLP